MEKLSDIQIRAIVNDLNAMPRKEVVPYINAMPIDALERNAILSLYNDDNPPVGCSPISSSEGLSDNEIDEIITPLLDLSRYDALLRIGAMRLNNDNENMVVKRYKQKCDEYIKCMRVKEPTMVAPLEDEKIACDPVSMWRYPLSVLISFLILWLLPIPLFFLVGKVVSELYTGTGDVISSLIIHTISSGASVILSLYVMYCTLPAYKTLISGIFSSFFSAYFLINVYLGVVAGIIPLVIFGSIIVFIFIVGVAVIAQNESSGTEAEGWQ